MGLDTRDDVQVWRIEWNTTGTILASSGDDNVVRLWKQRFDVAEVWSDED